MVSRIGAWFKKNLTTTQNTKQLGEVEDVPDPTEDFIQSQATIPQQRRNTDYAGGPQSREARFSGRQDRNRDSFKQARASNNADRRRSGQVSSGTSNQLNLQVHNSRGARGSTSSAQSSQPGFGESPSKQSRSSHHSQQSASSIEYQPGELPKDFHRRVVDLEIKVEMHGVSQNDNEKQIRLLSDLMQLYSAAIEHYNRTRDEENYAYYIEKLQKLNAQIRVLIEREERTLDRMKVKKQQKAAAKKEKESVAQDPYKPSGGAPVNSLAMSQRQSARNSMPKTAGTKPAGRATSIQPPKLSVVERKKMRNNFQMALATKAQEEPEQSEATVDKHFEGEREAKQKLEKDMVSQKDRLQQRLAERKRSRAMRATSQANNQTLPLNFDNKQGSLIEGTGDISIASVGLPMMQSSAMNQSTVTGQAQNESSILTNDLNESSPLKKSMTLRLVKTTSRDDDTFSQGNRSTTTQGGGLANKINQSVSRILSQSVNQEVTDEDEVQDLVNLLDELNAHHDLGVKLANQSKILKFLSEASDQVANPAGAKTTPAVKDYKVTIGKAKSEFGRLGFQSKMRLEMKQLMIDPKVKEIVEQSRQKLDELQQQKDEEIEEFQEEHAEAKYKANQKVKQKFKVQIALATKQKDTDKKKELEVKQKEELKKVETEMQEKGVEGKNKIKERFNELAQKITIDTSEFMKALLKKKELKLNQQNNRNAEEEKSVELPDTIDVGIKTQASPQLEEGDTLESTPTPMQQHSQERAKEESEVIDGQLENIEVKSN